MYCIYTYIYIYIYIVVLAAREAVGRAAIARRPRIASSIIIVAIFYPFSQFCEINISLLSLQTQPNTAPNLFQRGVEYGKYDNNNNNNNNNDNNNNTIPITTAIIVTTTATTNNNDDNNNSIQIVRRPRIASSKTITIKL